MKQILMGADNGSLSASATRYHSLEAMGIVWESSIDQRETIVAEAGTLSLLRVDLVTAPGSGKQFVFTVMLNGVASALTVTIADAATTAQDTTHTVTVAAGDRLTLRAVPTGTPTTSLARWGSQYEPTTGTRAIWGTPAGPAPLDPAATRYNPVGVPSDLWHATLTQRDPVWGIDCTIKSLYVKLTSAPGVGKNYAFTIIKNGAAEATSTVTIADAATTGNVTGLTIDVAPGDNLALRCVPTGTPSNPGATYGISYAPDTDGQWNVSGMMALQEGYIHPLAGVEAAFGTLADNTALAGAASGAVSWSISGVRVELSGAPGSGQSRTFTVVKNGIMTVATVTVSDLATSGTGGSVVPFAPGDTWSFNEDSTAGAAAAVVRWTYGGGSGSEVEDPDQFRLMIAEVDNPDVPTLNITSQNFAPHGATLVRFERGRDAAFLGNPARAGEGSVQLRNPGLANYVLDQPKEGLAIRLNKKYLDVWRHLFQGNINVPQASIRERSIDPMVTLRAIGSIAKLQGKTISTELYVDVPVGTAIGHLLDAAEFPSFLRDLDLGAVTLPFWWANNEDAWAALLRLVNAEGITADLYEDGQGRLVFRSRDARYTETRSTTAQHTITSEGSAPNMHEFRYDTGSRGSVVNAAKATRIARVVGVAPSVVWTDNNGSGNYIIGPSDTLKLEAIATEPFQSAITPVLNTDYASGFGTGSVALERTSGQRTLITFTAGAGGWLIGPATGNDGIQLRATATVVGGTFTEVSTVDASASITAYGLRPWAGSMWPDMDWADMRDNLDAIVTLFKEPHGRVRVGINAIASAEANAAVALVEIGDRLRVTETELDLDADVWVERIEHEIIAPAASDDGEPPGTEFSWFECVVVETHVGSAGSGITDTNPYDSINNEELIGPPTLGDQGVTTTKAIMAGAGV